MSLYLLPRSSFVDIANEVDRSTDLYNMKKEGPEEYCRAFMEEFSTLKMGAKNETKTKPAGNQLDESTKIVEKEMDECKTSLE